MVLDNEPVRGGYPPPGFLSLPGVEQVRAMAQGLVPRPPIFRLFGIEVTHAGTGNATLRMPASPWLQGIPGTQHVQLLVRATARSTTRTIMASGFSCGLRHMSLNFIRPPQLDMESFIARGQVVMAGPTRATIEARVEDARGRLVVHGTSQFVISGPRSAPHAAPRLERHEEPSYATPDPPMRLFEADHRDVPWFGAEMIARYKRSIADDEPSLLPVLRLIGGNVTDVQEGTAECAVPATEWLCDDGRGVVGVAEVLASMATGVASYSVVPEGRALIQNVVDYSDVRSFPRRYEPDGRRIRARATVVHIDEFTVITDSVVLDQDDQPMLVGRATMSLWEMADTTDDRPSQRALATVLFADVVDSTPMAERLGDAKWREVLQRNLGLIRKAIATERGREIKTEGDGFLATFVSPIQAVRCARIVRAGGRGLGLEIRAGIHLGEVEILGTDIAGIAVHVASRVESLADPGMILVTSTVREAMAGSGLRFTSRGAHALKGLEDEWQLYAVEDEETE